MVTYRRSQLTKQQRDYQRYARRGTTTERGYGWKEHVKKQLAALAAWKPGDPCAQCGQPMWSRWTFDAKGKRVSALDLGHTDDRSGYIGLCHRSCNRRDGQRKTTAILNQRRGRQQRASRQW